MRCVSYTRTTSCKSSESIPTDIIQQQNEQIQKYIQSHGWKLVAKYSDRKRDDNENTAFEEMTMDGISRKFDMVVVNIFPVLKMSLQKHSSRQESIFQ